MSKGAHGQECTWASASFSVLGINVECDEVAIGAWVHLGRWAGGLVGKDLLGGTEDNQHVAGQLFAASGMGTWKMAGMGECCLLLSSRGRHDVHAVCMLHKMSTAERSNQPPDANDALSTTTQNQCAAC